MFRLIKPLSGLFREHQKDTNTAIGVRSPDLQYNNMRQMYPKKSSSKMFTQEALFSKNACWWLNQPKQVACFVSSCMLCTNDFEKIYLQLKTQRGCVISKWCSYDLHNKAQTDMPLFLTGYTDHGGPWFPKVMQLYYHINHLS